mgnify:CR=1 FL=1|tara:strand:- start:40 stop:774 length:735 start_codon:yes stop_codon:yes gene_type:complete
MKTCSKCKVEKDISEYHNDKSKKDGKRPSCKVCANNQNRVRTQTEEYKLYKKEYDANYRCSEAGVAVYKRRQKRRNKLYKTDETYRQKQLEKGLKHRLKDGAKEKQAEYQKNIPLEIRAKHNREYRRRNKDKFNEYTRNYVKKNKHMFAWRQILADTHKRLGTTKEFTTKKELGYSANELKKHLENLFTDGMSWGNHGEWHIDHIKPVSKFNKESKASLVNALSNLQPLWAKDNLSKSNTFLQG